jgi:hypothetical protein
MQSLAKLLGLNRTMSSSSQNKEETADKEQKKIEYPNGDVYEGKIDCNRRKHSKRHEKWLRRVHYQKWKSLRRYVAQRYETWKGEIPV